MSCERTGKGHTFTFASGVLFRSYRNRFHGQVAKRQARAQVSRQRASPPLEERRARGRGGPLSPREAARASTPSALLR